MFLKEMHWMLDTIATLYECNIYWHSFFSRTHLWHEDHRKIIKVGVTLVNFRTYFFECIFNEGKISTMFELYSGIAMVALPSRYSNCSFQSSSCSWKPYRITIEVFNSRVASSSMVEAIRSCKSKRIGALQRVAILRRKWWL